MTNEINDERKHCPQCGQRSSSAVDTIFVEYGEWNDDTDSYDVEGDVNVFRCADSSCGFEFADVTGIPDSDEKPEWVPVQTLASDQDPKTTTKGLGDLSALRAEGPDL